jgi:hypothetical protein
MLFEFKIGTLTLTHGHLCVMNSSMNSTISTLGAFKRGGIAQIVIPFMHFVHPLLNCIFPLLNHAHPLPDCAHPLSNSSLCSFSTLSPFPNGMSHPPMLTSLLSLSLHSVGRCSFVQGGDLFWLIGTATMTVFLYNAPWDLMEGWCTWGLSPSWFLRNQFPQPQIFQGLETAGLNTTSFHERATTGSLNLSFRMYLELRNTPRSVLRMS